LAPALTVGANLYGLGLAQTDDERKPCERRRVGVDVASPSRAWELFGKDLPRCLALAPWVRENPRRKRAFLRLRGKDSNLDYLIQSQASYR
jgi:hypothetical protein